MRLRRFLTSPRIDSLERLSGCCWEGVRPGLQIEGVERQDRKEGVSAETSGTNYIAASR